jgi:2-amino-4-hydroxy-6-hydroxymethyldihydropteridine diphosphokinase
MTETPNPHIVDADSLTGEMHPIRRVVLGLGSNLGERLGSLQGAVNALADTPDCFVTGVSPVYETEQVDAPEGSRPYLNAVLLADTTLPAARLMERALAIEDAFDRERSDIRNAPRTLDVDLIVVGDRRSNEDFLRLPHPRAHERAFVLQPWHDLEPDAVFPDRGPIAELLDASDSSGVKRREDLTLEVEWADRARTRPTRTPTSRAGRSTPPRRAP